MEAKKAAFMGKITAGLTHEMKNVLAIIKESAGLLEDLISLAKDDALPQRDKFLRTLYRITQQVARGVDLSTKLNTFAHASDEREANMDLNEVAGQIAFLCQRFARLKQMTLEARRHERVLVIRVDPLAVQMLLFECVDLLMNIVEAGSAITLHPTDNGGPVILIKTAGGQGGSGTAPYQAATESARWLGVRTTAESLNVSVETGGPPPWISIGFSG